MLAFEFCCFDFFVNFTSKKNKNNLSAWLFCFTCCAVLDFFLFMNKLFQANVYLHASSVCSLVSVFLSVLLFLFLLLLRVMGMMMMMMSPRRHHHRRRHPPPQWRSALGGSERLMSLQLK